MKRLLFIAFAMFTFGAISAQEDMTLEQLQAKKAEVKATFDKATADANAAQAELDALQKRINMLSGWITGVTGLVGFDLSGSNKWIANPNPTSNSTGLSIGLTGFANREQEKYFWNNKLIINKAWQDIDRSEADENLENDGLFDNGTVDILNLSSLAGYKLSEKWAISAMAEFNSSIENFLEPATFDIGAGVTWKPITNLTVVIHPLNYHVAWSSQDNVSAEGALGAKIRADYQDEFMIAGRKIAWSSTLTSFLPYSDTKTSLDQINKYGEPILGADGMPLQREAGLFEWTWLNTFSFQVWKGIGVGFNLGLRNAEFEYPDTQMFYSLGLTYTL